MKDCNPHLSIITVVFNDVHKIEGTILSIIQQEFDDFEYIVIDGGSTDGTLEVVNKYEKYVSKILSEPDNGIYDAMNKAIDIANGEWLNFMNSGDRYFNKMVLKNIFSEQKPDNIEFIYSDWYTCDYHINASKLHFVEGSYEKGRLLHQSILYKKKLHDTYGKYLITEKLIISDYIFFSLIPLSKVYKTSYPISINDRNGFTGVSSSYWPGEQKIVVDFLFGRLKLNEMVNILRKHLIILKINKISKRLGPFDIIKIKNYLHEFVARKWRNL